jgi:transposase
MIKKEGCMEIKILHRQEEGIREIARRTGLSRKTVRTSCLRFASRV